MITFLIKGNYSFKQINCAKKNEQLILLNTNLKIYQARGHLFNNSYMEISLRVSSLTTSNASRINQPFLSFKKRSNKI